MLVAAAAEAGAEIREAFIVDEIVVEDGRACGIKGHAKGGRSVTEHADVVIGADGWHSIVAEAVGADTYRQTPPLLAAYYSYWSGLPIASRFEIYIRPNRGFAAAPTHDGLTVVIGGWPYAEFGANKSDVEGNFDKMLDLAPEFAERVRGAKREARFAGATLPGYFRKPYGPGWVLVGDAGCLKDPITAQGIADAFRDAERCAAALREVFSGARAIEDAMADYHRDRDRDVLPMYELTCRLATLAPPPPHLQQLLTAIQGDQAAQDGFVQANAGTISPAAFFSPENIGAILSKSGRLH